LLIMQNLKVYKSPLVSEQFMSRWWEVVAKGLVCTKPEVYQAMRPTDHLYHLPVPSDKIIVFGAIRASPSHVGGLSYSVDLYCDHGTPIFAASAGTVVRVRSSKNVHGNTIDMWDEGNFIDIRCRHQEDGREAHTWYEHMPYNGILVREGQEVERGQHIAFVGNTGFTENPHLHLQVHVSIGDGPRDIKTLGARFEDFEPVYEHIGLKPLMRIA